MAPKKSPKKAPPKNAYLTVLGKEKCLARAGCCMASVSHKGILGKKFAHTPQTITSIVPIQCTQRRSARLPLHIAQYLFEIVSQTGILHPFYLVFMSYRASIAEIPLCGGDHTSTSHALQGETLRKGGGVCTQLAMLRHQKPDSVQ